MQVAIIGGGCFWCIEAIYLQVKGVVSAQSGYSGGFTPNPTYEAVCRTNTGHAEVVRVEFDERVISYEQILDIFFAIHDPTTLNRQGADVGTQYRSIILYSNAAQQQKANEAIARHQKSFAQKIVTEVTPFESFYKAESYHQNYYNLHKMDGYCRIVIEPKLNKFIQHNSDFIK